MSKATVTDGMSVRYKTKQCKSFIEDGKCNFGNRCCFAHSETEMVQGKMSKILDEHSEMVEVIKDVMSKRGVGFEEMRVVKPLFKGASDDILDSKIAVLEQENARLCAEKEDLQSKVAECTSLLEAIGGMTSGFVPVIKSACSSSENFAWADDVAEKDSRALGQQSWTKVLKQPSKSR